MTAAPEPVPTAAVNARRWDRLSAALGITPAGDEYERLHAAYSEPQRAYHTVQHLSECLNLLDWAEREHGLPDAAVAEVALWYHDAVYRPRAGDNERQSAVWAVGFLRAAGLDSHTCEQVHALIMATCHGEKPHHTLQQRVVDVDLAILGTDRTRFDEYEQQVREEYRWVPWLLYKRKRAEVLRHFLAAPRVYNSELFHARYEQQARDNLRRSLADLTA